MRRWLARRKGRSLAIAAAAVAAAIFLMAGGLNSSACGGAPSPSCPSTLRPPIELEPQSRIDGLAASVARRVERLRGLEFHDVPGVRVVSDATLARAVARLGADSREPGGEGASLAARRARSRLAFLELAGLVSRDSAPAQPNDAEQGISAVYDYSRHVILVAADKFQSWERLELTLVHEMTHALEAEHFDLHLRTIGAPLESAEAHHAMVEGTATLVAALYRREYMHDQVPLRERLSSNLSGALGALPKFLADLAALDYIDGPMFAARLRARGGWALVDRALRHPPTRVDEILHPATWPDDSESTGVRLGVNALPGPRWRSLGGGPAGEDLARFTLSLAKPIEGVDAGSGWAGGRLVAWRRPGASCEGACRAGSAAVAAFRWRTPGAAGEFARAAKDYMLIGIFGQAVGTGVWRVGDGFAALVRHDLTTALAYAPGRDLARRLAISASATR